MTAVRSSGSLGARPIVLSPHLDDAVFSLGASISRASRAGAFVTVLTVFAGDPDAEGPPSWWDRRGGFASEGEAARARRAEDERACSRLGAEPVWLPFRDAAYESRQQPSDIAAALTDAVARVGGDTLLVPGFPMRHPDHALLATIALARRLPDLRIGLYTEQPYAWRLGRPPEAPAPWSRLRAQPTDLLAKQRAAREYRSQLPLLGRFVAARIALHERMLGGEAVAWLDEWEALPATDGVMGPEALRARIAALVAERQALRETAAAHELLERNRLEIARLEREFSYALIEEHLALPQMSLRLAVS